MPGTGVNASEVRPIAQLLWIIFFSNAFSNADGYERSRPNAGALKPQYCNQVRSPVNISELKETKWHARGPGFESPYLHLLGLTPLVGPLL